MELKNEKKKDQILNKEYEKLSKYKKLENNFQEKYHYHRFKQEKNSTNEKKYNVIGQQIISNNNF